MNLESNRFQQARTTFNGLIRFTKCLFPILIRRNSSSVSPFSKTFFTYIRKFDRLSPHLSWYLFSKSVGHYYEFEIDITLYEWELEYYVRLENLKCSLYTIERMRLVLRLGLGIVLIHTLLLQLTDWYSEFHCPLCCLFSFLHCPSLLLQRKRSCCVSLLPPAKFLISFPLESKSLLSHRSLKFTAARRAFSPRFELFLCFLSLQSFLSIFSFNSSFALRFLQFSFSPSPWFLKLSGLFFSIEFQIFIVLKIRPISRTSTTLVPLEPWRLRQIYLDIRLVTAVGLSSLIDDSQSNPPL